MRTVYNENAYQLGSKRSTIREIFEYAKKRSAEIGGENVFDFSIGNPSVPAPDAVNEAIVRIVNETPSVALHGYTSAQGDKGVRDKIAANYAKRFGVPLSGDDLYMTCGAAASLTVTLHALTCEGDEFIVFAPFFPEYAVFVQGAGAKLTVLASDPKTMLPDFGALEKALNPHVKGVLINSPNNPSGVVYGEETMSRLAEILRKKSVEYGNPVYLISDEPYRELIYDKDTVVPCPMKYYDDTVVCYSYSKSLSMPGERIGYIAVCPKMQDALPVYLAVCGAGRSLGYVCAPSLMQQVIGLCLDAQVNVEAYKENRDLLYNHLTACGYECVKPDGAFYLFVKALEPDAYAFFERAKAHEILVVPCDDFGLKGYVRIAYCTDKKTVLGALPAFEALAKEYRA